MQYGFRNLSQKMEETVRIMKSHGQLIRYDGGFWSWDDVEFKKCKNGKEEFVCPIWWCDVKTLRALQKRNIVNLDENRKVCLLN